MGLDILGTSLSSGGLADGDGCFLAGKIFLKRKLEDTFAENDFVSLFGGVNLPVSLVLSLHVERLQSGPLGNAV